MSQWKKYLWLLIPVLYVYACRTRPLFIGEFAPALEWRTLFPAGEHAFYLRLCNTVYTFLAAAYLYFFCRRAGVETVGRSAAALFLLIPSVFFCGTAAGWFGCRTLAVLLFSGESALALRRKNILITALTGASGLAAAALFGEWSLPDGERMTNLLWCLAGLLPLLPLAPAWIPAAAVRRDFIRGWALALTGAGVLLACFSDLGGVALAGVATLAGAGLVRRAEQHDFRIADRGLLMFNSLLLAGTIVFFAVHALARVGVRAAARISVYQPGEWLLIPVGGALLVLMWYQMAAGEKLRAELKFIYFCIGTGILLLTASAAPPAALVLKYAPESALRKFVGGNVSRNTRVYADQKFSAVARWVFATAAPPPDAANIRSDVEYGAGNVFVLLRPESDRRTLPPPQMVWRTGGIILLGYPGREPSSMKSNK